MEQTARQYMLSKMKYSPIHEELLIEFAKLHVEAALESVAENTKEWHGNHGMLKQSILNAYPLTNIK